jgi:hypothetical protein
MAQVFSARAVLLLKLAGIAFVVVLAAALISTYKYFWGPDTLAEAPSQPIPFSHKHHVGDDGIDCRYCHDSVEKSSFAGIPPTHTCMSCHSQLFTDQAMLEPVRRSMATGERLRWVRVHTLPDFVYFDHSIHIAKGVACIECHGQVDRMPLIRRVASLDMNWCLGCHRDPEPHRRKSSLVFVMRPTSEIRAEGGMPDTKVVSTRRLTDCSTCHR